VCKFCPIENLSLYRVNSEYNEMHLFYVTNFFKNKRTKQLLMKKGKEFLKANVTRLSNEDIYFPKKQIRASTKKVCRYLD